MSDGNWFVAIVIFLGVSFAFRAGFYRGTFDLETYALRSSYWVIRHHPCTTRMGCCASDRMVNGQWRCLDYEDIEY